MALFELNIYGKDDEIVKKYETDKVRWGVYMQALQLEETIRGANTGEKFSQIGAFVKKIFPDLTDAELENADGDDVLNTFAQLVKKSNQIKSGNEGKNG